MPPTSARWRRSTTRSSAACAERDRGRAGRGGPASPPSGDDGGPGPPPRVPGATAPRPGFRATRPPEEGERMTTARRRQARSAAEETVGRQPADALVVFGITG